MFPPEVVTRTVCGTRANVSWTLPPPLAAVTAPAARARPVMLPPLVRSVSGPDAPVAVRSPPPLETETGPDVPVTVALPPLVVAVTPTPAGTAADRFSSQSPTGTGQR